MHLRRSSQQSSSESKWAAEPQLFFPQTRSPKQSVSRSQSPSPSPHLELGVQQSSPPEHTKHKHLKSVCRKQLTWICSWCWQSLTTVHRLDGCQRIKPHAVVFSTRSASYTFVVFIAITFSMLTLVCLRAALPCWRRTVRWWSYPTSGGSSDRSRSGCEAPPSFVVSGRSNAAVSSTGGVAGAVVHTTDQRAGAVIVRMAVTISKTTGPILCALRAAVSRVGYVPFAVVGATEETA